MMLCENHRKSKNNGRRALAVEPLEERHLLAADLVIEWNRAALDAIRAESTAPPIASRALAIMQAAVYDSMNAIDRTGQVYAVDALAAPNTSHEAAVAAAAHTALVSLFPNERAAFDARFQADLAAIPNGQPEDLGVALGDRVAQQMLALRSNDGSTTVVPYTPGNQPGDWIPTPPAFAPAAFPNWAELKPFAMTSDSQFSPDGAPALDSPEYTAAFDEIKSLGSATSATRTADQTNIALFWANGAGTATPAGHLNVVAQIVAEQRGNTLAQNARLFAELNVAMADAAIMAWNSKFAVNYWRPVTAIRAADTDGNPATTSDPTWTPLIATPPFPSYVSGHASFSAAAAAVLQSFFGTDNVAFTLPSENPAVPARSFTSFSQAAQESADSRLYGGIHWRFDNEDGLSAGQQLGQYVAAHFFRPEARPAAAGLVGSMLIVNGTDNSDLLLIDEARGQNIVRQGGRQIGAFAAAQVGTIIIGARGGNDLVSLGPRIHVAATIFGGAGDDVLIGGAAADAIYGEAGNDLLLGMAGSDLLDGGDGNDLLIGGPGNDALNGGHGRNRLIR